MRKFLLSITVVTALIAIIFEISSGNSAGTTPPTEPSLEVASSEAPRAPDLLGAAENALPLPGPNLDQQLAMASPADLAASRPTDDAAGNAATVPTPPQLLTEERVETVRRGDTLMVIMNRAGITAGPATDAIQALVKVFNPRELKPGQAIRMHVEPGQDTSPTVLRAVHFQAGVDRDIAVRRTSPSAFEAQAIPRKLTTTLARAGGVIDSSLFNAGVAAHVPVQIMFEMIRQFSFDVDFQRDIQPGDSFELLYEQTHDEDGKLARTGKIFYLSLTLSGKPLVLYRFEPGVADMDFFNPKGESVKKALLRTPVDGAKITSSFGMRGHPILGYTRMHRGLDFGAPSGTPIMAAGDGVIDQVGGRNGYGNYIRVRHNSEFATAYAHMSRYASGIHQGVRVRQGQIIGFVGMTGLATGPHLHYEVLKQAQQINPLSVKMPSGRKLEGKELAQFKAVVADLDKQMKGMPDPLKTSDKVADAAQIKSETAPVTP